MWYKTKFKVERKAQTGVSASGQPILAPVVIIPLALGDFISGKQQMSHEVFGHSILTLLKLVCPVMDIQSDDIITNLDTAEVFLATNIEVFDLLPRLQVSLTAGAA